MIKSCVCEATSLFRIDTIMTLGCTEEEMIWMYLDLHLSAAHFEHFTLHKVESPGHVVLPGTNEAGQHVVWFLPEGVLHPLGQIITTFCLLLNNCSQLLHC